MEKNKLNNIIFMKYGVHGSESVESIIKRKQNENEDKSFWWGYGSKVCHPLTQVKPFVQECNKSNEKVYLVLEYTSSVKSTDDKNKADCLENRANQYSVDNKKWYEINNNINVFDSKYALICKNLKKVDLKINLSDYEVAIGGNKGKLLSDYINGQNDKGCARLTNVKVDESKAKIIQVDYIAEVVCPYAVFLRKYE